MTTLSHAALHRLAVRDALRQELAGALARIYDATHVAMFGAALHCYGSKAECVGFADGLRGVQVRAITEQEQHDQAQHKRQVYRKQGA